MIISGGVERLGASGYVDGDETVGSLTLTVTDQSSFHVLCCFNHYGYINSWGCARKFMGALGGTSGMHIVFDDNITSGNGGSWTITRTSATTLTIQKTAGSYSGGGYWFIDIVGNNLISFA